MIAVQKLTANVPEKGRALTGTRVTAQARRRVPAYLKTVASRIRSITNLPQRGTEQAEPARIVTFDGLADEGEHVAVLWGPVGERPLVRIHSECLTGDALASARCDCGEQLAEAMAMFKDNGGILLYLRQEGRGIGLYNKIDAYALQDKGVDTIDANLELGLPVDARHYDVAVQMLNALGCSEIDLITNNPGKVSGLENGGIYVAHRIGTGVFHSSQNHRYLETKRSRMGHLIDFSEALGKVAP
jgi:GTP cyclohydrolase II